MAQRKRRSRNTPTSCASRVSSVRRRRRRQRPTTASSRDAFTPSELFSHRGSALVAAAHSPLIGPCAASWFVAAGGPHNAPPRPRATFAASRRPARGSDAPRPAASSYASRGAVGRETPSGARRRAPCSPPPAAATARRSASQRAANEVPGDQRPADFCSAASRTSDRGAVGTAFPGGTPCASRPRRHARTSTRRGATSPNARGAGGRPGAPTRARRWRLHHSS